MDLLHAVKLRHGTDGFTSPPKEGVLRIFSLRPGVKPRTWVPKASTLPLDHGSRCVCVIALTYFDMQCGSFPLIDDLCVFQSMFEI